MIIQHVKVYSNRCVASQMYELVLNTDIPEFLPGQFIQLYLAGRSSFFMPRPFSIYKLKNGQLSILYKIYGKATLEISQLNPGDSIKMWGPLGNSFSLDKNIHRAMIAGGVGIPPIVALAESVQNLGGHTTVFIGGRTKADIICIEALKAVGAEIQIATNDGSMGFAGFVTDLFKERIHIFEKIYACGPKPMEKVVAHLAVDHHIACELSMEEVMACGIGICVGCVVPVKDGDSFTFKKLCSDGPVIKADCLALEKMEW